MTGELAKHMYFDQIKVGDKMVTRGRTITEADIVNFAALTWDFYPLHSDAEYAKTTPYGQRIAHGMLVLSYAIGLTIGEPGRVVAFYGIDKLRFTAPTYIGDTMHVEVEVLELADKGAKGGVVTSHLQVINQRNETVISAETKMLMAKTP